MHRRCIRQLGEDWPFGIGNPDPRRVVENTALTEAERRAMLGGTAARIFHIDHGCVAAGNPPVAALEGGAGR